MQFQSFTRFYISVTLLLANVFLLFVAMNLGAYVLLKATKALTQENPVETKYGRELLAAAYPDMNEGEIKALLNETWSRANMEYEPFTQFKERVYAGRYVNIDGNGFRRGHEQAVWPPSPDAVNVFVFGGSTTFGYGVPDNETLPSHLQNILRQRVPKVVNVYNFGRGFYFSSQERVLFEQLLLAGHKPDIAIFVDGLNDFFNYKGEPKYTPSFRRQLDGKPDWNRTVGRLPVVKLMHKIVSANGEGEKVLDVDPGDTAMLHGVIDRYFANRRIIRAIATAHGVNPLFVWQPVPGYLPGENANPFMRARIGAHVFSAHGYPLMQRRVAAEPKSDDFLWAADMQIGQIQPLYVDQVHYSGSFARAIAHAIEQHLLDTPAYSSKLMDN